jgi:hypothetical protein
VKKQKKLAAPLIVTFSLAMVSCGGAQMDKQMNPPAPEEEVHGNPPAPEEDEPEVNANPPGHPDVEHGNPPAPQDPDKK